MVDVFNPSPGLWQQEALCRSAILYFANKIEKEQSQPSSYSAHPMWIYVCTTNGSSGTRQPALFTWSLGIPKKRSKLFLRDFWKKNIFGLFLCSSFINRSDGLHNFPLKRNIVNRKGKTASWTHILLISRRKRESRQVYYWKRLKQEGTKGHQ